MNANARLTLSVMAWVTALVSTILFQCCQSCVLPAELGYFEIACCGSKKNFWAGVPKIDLLFMCLPMTAHFFSSNLPVSYQFREFFEPFQCSRTFYSSISGIKNVLERNQYKFSTSRGSQQSNCFSAQLGDFDYFAAEKYPNLENWVHNYLIKVGLL